MADNLKLTALTGDYEIVRALKEGKVKAEGIDLQFPDPKNARNIHVQMARGEFDIGEFNAAAYMAAKFQGRNFTALPIFLVRAFHHGAILKNVKTGIRAPKDLEGRKVGVNRGYTVTTGVWARGILQEEYGVDLSKITWVLSGDEHVADYRPPANVQPIEVPVIPFPKLLLWGLVLVVIEPAIVV